MYFNCIIPPLFQKKYPDKLGEKLIIKIIRSIRKFMKEFEYSMMKNDEIFYTFISTEKECEFEKRKIYIIKLQDLIL